MKLLPLLATAVAVAEVASATLQGSSDLSHSHGHLFARHNKREPAALYQGEDPQLQLVGKRSTRPHNHIHEDSPRRRGSDFLDVNDLAPADMVKRQASTTSPGTGTPYPPAGSDPPSASTLPQSWVDRYNAVKKQGLIPDIPIAKEDATTGLTSYPSGTDMKKVCSWTANKCFPEGTIYEAPQNSVALGVDDGPTPAGTPGYLATLSAQNVSVTHFLIGSACFWNTDVLKQLAAASPKQNLAVHTWSHTLQTTKTDLEVLGDLGWTMQIIYDYSGFVPAYFRPPEGDTDARVSAIAKYVFGMQTVMWTHDADDWCLRQGNGTATSINSCVQSAPNLKTVRAAEVGWATQTTDKSGWISLNHETTDQASSAFASMVKAIKAGSWKLEGTVPDLQGLPWYNNAYGPNDTPTKPASILPTRDIVNVTDGTAAKGSSGAPKLGNWAKSAIAQNPAVGAQASGSNASGSASTSSKSSSAATIGVSGALIATLVTAFAVALTV